MRSLIWAAVCLPALLVGPGADAQQATVPNNCPDGKMRGADGQCIPDTGTGQSGSPGGGTAAVEAAKGGSAAGSNTQDAPADASKLGPGAVGPSTGDKAAPDAGTSPAPAQGSSQ